MSALVAMRTGVFPSAHCRTALLRTTERAAGAPLAHVFPHSVMPMLTSLALIATALLLVRDAGPGNHAITEIKAVRSRTQATS